MSLPEIVSRNPASDVVVVIAKSALSDAIEIITLINLIREQNAGGLNKRLAEAGAGQASRACRNALIARLVILTARAYVKPRNGDRHVQVAVNLLQAKTVRDTFTSGGNAERMDAFDAQWLKCKQDERLPKIKAFRDKYTAHLGEPEEIQEATYVELFEFGVETAKSMELLALAANVATKRVSSDPSLTASAQAFWRPWKSSGST
jgi:hypothetical protein